MITKYGIEIVDISQEMIHQETLVIDGNVEGCPEFVEFDSTPPPQIILYLKLKFKDGKAVLCGSLNSSNGKFCH